MHKYAMLFGTYMGGFWIIKFILFPLGLTMPFLSLLFLGLTLCVPFLGFYYARMFREQGYGGSINFLQAWSFTVTMYIFAALLTAVAHYIYFRFIDDGFVIDTLISAYQTQANMMRQSSLPDSQAYVDLFKQAIEMLESVNATDITLQLLSWNIFCGVLLAIPTALFVMKRKHS